MATKTFSFSLDETQDADLIERIGGLGWGKLSGVVRAALREYWQDAAEGVTLQAIARLLDDKLSTLSLAPGEQPTINEDVEGTQEGASNLDNCDFG